MARGLPPRSVPQSRAATPAPGDEPGPRCRRLRLPKVIQQDSRYLPAYGSAGTAAKPLIGMSVVLARAPDRSDLYAAIRRGAKEHRRAYRRLSVRATSVRQDPSAPVWLMRTA
jgi:hypothetical protein